ncbi:Rieske (2Fe-2S) protein [Streptomyces sp. HU2014]|uniref:aromatic ring-hydroxylating oxygenase subunit alpha n=1 Tax=Streptomyces sp. HU2014 TaxID=2939414 RepID=UPI00200F9543|nr:Rieske 2Fe-2S domain-containing protein [Streptomyces sp. HU2014]UQI45807.1 Rieske (2Fe-2S) protein [Streptomyces sp. HU2014]
MHPDELPMPNGWFAIGMSRDLKPGKVLRARLAGADVVAYRTHSGRLAVVDPYCPHLGAHLGFGGTVEGENLVCPFHRFAFDPAGRCVATGYGTPPPKAALHRREWRESNGFIWVWHHAEGPGPSWEIPVGLADGKILLTRVTHSIRTHPADIVENAADLGHLNILHSGRNIRPSAPAEFSGPSARYRSEGELIFPLLGALRLQIDITCWGLGCVAARARLPGVGFDALAMSSITPESPGRVKVMLTVHLSEPALRRIPSQRARSSLRKGMYRVAPLLGPLTRFIDQELRQDIPVWENKIILSHPRLAKGDGPITAYRRWAEQFYSPANKGSGPPPGPVTPPETNA